MAFSAHLKVDGIEGETADKNYDGQIDVLSYSVAVSNSPNTLGGGFSAGKASPSDFTFMLAQGRSSVNLEKFCASGKHVDSVILTLAKSIGEDAGLQDFMTVTFTDCYISSVSESGGGDVPINAISITYSQKKVEYKEQKTAGGSLENAANYGWDFKANAAMA